MIQFEDFEEMHLDDHPVPYYEYNDGEVKICLEPCAAGMCVGIYDEQNWILAEKLCTNMPGHPKEEIRSKAVALANVMYEDYKKKHVIE